LLPASGFVIEPQTAAMLVEQFKVESPNVQYGDDSITSTYTYTHTEVERTDEGKWKVAPKATEYTFKTDTRVPKLGCVGPAAGRRTVPAGPGQQPDGLGRPCWRLGGEGVAGGAAAGARRRCSALR
jgi:hypothetical protein